MQLKSVISPVDSEKEHYVVKSKPERILRNSQQDSEKEHYVVKSKQSRMRPILTAYSEKEHYVVKSKQRVSVGGNA